MIYIGNGIYSDANPNEYLQHYGVKGMKWGQHIFGDREKSGDGRHSTLKKVGIGLGIAAAVPIAIVGGAAVAGTILNKRHEKNVRKLKSRYFNSDGTMTPEGKEKYAKWHKIKECQKAERSEFKKIKDKVNKEYMKRNNTTEKMYQDKMDGDDEWEVLESAKEYNISMKKYNTIISNGRKATEDFWGDNKGVRDYSLYEDVFKDVKSAKHADPLREGNYLQHYGVKGMKWGQHLFSKDPTYFGGQKKKKQSAKQWAENKHRAHVANAEANKRKVNINASVSVNNKTKKLPRTSLGVLMKYDSLNENEYNQAMKNIRRRNEVYDAVINDAYRVHRAVNFAPTVLNDVTKTIRNVDYLSDRLRRHYNSKNNKQTILGAEPKYVNVEDQKDLVVSKYKAQH